nr:reverse transcriptase domain-containing protein [Tanacetum cinerariifolium]
MQTYSSSRFARNQSSNSSASTNPNPKGRNHIRPKQRIENLDLDDLSEPIDTMADQRTMAQLLQAPTEGYEDAIVVPAITAENFELKHGLLTLVQNKQLFEHDKEDPHAHVRYFNKITSTLKVENSNLEEHSPPVFTMADQRTMAQLLQAPTEGYEDAIFIPAITADNFELKHGLLTLVKNEQFYGHDKEDPHAHIHYFNKITSTLKFLNVYNT